jgi:hypothetical protein
MVGRPIGRNLGPIVSDSGTGSPERQILLVGQHLPLADKSLRNDAYSEAGLATDITNYQANGLWQGRGRHLATTIATGGAILGPSLTRA